MSVEANFHRNILGVDLEIFISFILGSTKEIAAKDKLSWSEDITDYLL